MVGWRSPVSDRLDIQDRFEHGQPCCGENSRIRWTVERGHAPAESHKYDPLPQREYSRFPKRFEAIWFRQPRNSGRPERLTDPDVTGASVVEELLA